MCLYILLKHINDVSDKKVAHLHKPSTRHHKNISSHIPFQKKNCHRQFHILGPPSSPKPPKNPATTSSPPNPKPRHFYFPKVSHSLPRSHHSSQQTLPPIVLRNSRSSYMALPPPPPPPPALLTIHLEIDIGTTNNTYLNHYPHPIIILNLPKKYACTYRAQRSSLGR